MRIRNACVVLLALISIGCVNIKGINAEQVRQDRYTIINDELWVNTTTGDRYRLSAEGQNYHPLASPNGEWLAVEIQLMSNLRALKIYQKTEGEFVEINPSVATFLWSRVRDEQGVDIDNVINPSINVRNWMGNDRLEVVLSGVGDKSIPFAYPVFFNVSDLEK